MAITQIMEVRLACGDLDQVMPFLDDATYQYYLDKNYGSIRKSALDAARTILLLLSQRNSETVDCLAVTGGHKAAEQYRLALQMLINSPDFNPLFTSVQGYAGGISNQDYETNLVTTDNKAVQTPQEALQRQQPSSSTSGTYFTF